MYEIKGGVDGYWDGNRWTPYDDIVVVDTNPFDIEVLDVTGKCAWCEEHKDDEQSLGIPYEIWREWQHLNSKYPEDEWGAVYWVKDGVIERYAIPEQEISAGEVEFTGKDLGGNGLVHWHHGMGGFHSHQDDKHARNLYEYSIVLSTKENICTRRVKAPCGGFGYVKCGLKVTGVPDIELDTSMIKKAAPVTVPIYGESKPGLIWHPEKNMFAVPIETKKLYDNFTRGEAEEEYIALSLMCDACAKVSYCNICQAKNEMRHIEKMYPDIATKPVPVKGKIIGFNGGNCETCFDRDTEFCDLCAQQDLVGC